MVLCAFCHRKIDPKGPKKETGGAIYHAGCWDRKARQRTKQKTEDRSSASQQRRR